MIENETHNPTHQKKQRRRKYILGMLALIFILLAIIWFIYWLVWGQFHEYTDDAYVDGNLVRLMSQVPGTVVSINTDDTQMVSQGQTLVKLDETDTRIFLERAQSKLAETVRQVRQLYENVQQTQAAIILRQANLKKAKFDLGRRQGLVQERAISREEMQHYLLAVDAAQAEYEVAKARYHAALSLVENTNLYHHPLVESAKVNLKNAYLNFYRTTIISPVTVQVGQQVSLRTALMAVVPLNEIWVEANYKESQLARLRIGQKVVLTADAYGGIQFNGTVHGISAGTGSAFDLLPPQNATGNWIKIVQRVPVRIDLDAEQLKKHPLRIGLSMRVTTNTFDTKGNILTQAPEVKPVFSTLIFNNQLQAADKLITAILHANAPDVSLSSRQKNTTGV
jgi:membrane fusion protein (multidrug efflux system)